MCNFCREKETVSISAVRVIRYIESWGEKKYEWIEKNVTLQSQGRTVSLSVAHPRTLFKNNNNTNKYNKIVIRSLVSTEFFVDPSMQVNLAHLSPTIHATKGLNTRTNTTKRHSFPPFYSLLINIYLYLLRPWYFYRRLPWSSGGSVLCSLCMSQGRERIEQK